jgi:Phage integrase family
MFCLCRLPTGRAIADYLRFERPKTTNRLVFVRHVAPRDQSISPALVRKTIRQAYARAGPPYTRAHLLRHTMASRLLEGGSSLKEVAGRFKATGTQLAAVAERLRRGKSDPTACPGVIGFTNGDWAGLDELVQAASEQESEKKPKPTSKPESTGAGGASGRHE